MAHKEFALDERMVITVYKRKASRNLRLSVAADGKIRVSIPTWAPYRAGVEFARKRRQWIEEQRKPVLLMADGQAVGKAHHLRFAPSAGSAKIRAVVRKTEVIVQFPASLSTQDGAVQAAAHRASIRALRHQAEQLLPQRLAVLAENHGFSYNNVSIKQMKSRWGSCDQRQNIVLNLYLMQLPWESIDYVLLHELTHTKILRHGPVFWEAMEKVLPDVKQRRKMMLVRQPVLDSPLMPGL
jgi:predicted metal-dependent hydrolase